MTYQWLRPENCDPPHRVTHEDRLADLIQSLSIDGWKDGEPALLGYPWGDKIQLLSGSHRWAAATAIGMEIPVAIIRWATISEIYGTDEWVRMIAAPPRVTSGWRPTS